MIVVAVAKNYLWIQFKVLTTSIITNSLSEIGQMFEYYSSLVSNNLYYVIDSPHSLASETRLGVKIEDKERTLKKVQVLTQK